jgi:peptidoglycan/LPS O-acetylase OafA/YrhL
MNLRPNVFNAIDTPGRIPSIDVLRAVAAISVVLFHFDHLLPFGNAGVYLFFVISGFLVGGILTKKYLNQQINFGRFVIERGLKIWPSYFVFLIVGSLIAFLMYSESYPNAYIPLNEVARYLLFYRNYTGAPDHWNFDHVWTLCIEEHFYIILPFALLILLKTGKPTLRIVIIFAATLAISSIASKLLTFLYFPEKPITTPTHNSLDGFAYGIIIFCLREQKTYFSRAVKIIALITGILMLSCLALVQDNQHISSFVQDIVLGTISPLAFALITFGVLEFKFKKARILRIISYYSYNLYLWHLLFYYAIADHFGNGITGLIVYLLTAALLAFIFTTFIEEPFLRWRTLLSQKTDKGKYKTN